MDIIGNFQVKVGNYKTESKKRKKHEAVKSAFKANN